MPIISFFCGPWVFASSDSDLLEFIAWFLFFLSSFPGGFRFEGSNENEVEIECDFK